MEIRLSGSGNYSNKSIDAVSAPITSSKTEVKENTSSLAQLPSYVEIKGLETQGVSVSTADEQVVKALDRALKALQGPTVDFEVSVHKPTNTIMIKMRNKDTGELIREIPAEKTLDLVASMMKIAGILIDERI
ncbi:flagellar protein FlaG [Paenibacillus sp. 19GGS1-52]|uniref:flagellar protein FlaG n=1 Tax=Paenibacillus sp. 19GGS1-52 TaxID=2758563 RepID=UPI001EFBB911|nr:flagellar protein FlaG [Paenibacillus sp. 19GGS1-52]ULO07953.1 flagellar protein FlaG [Paenibacillus sp. 19GGS1-52]